MTFKPGQSGNPAGRKPRPIEEKYLKAVAKSMPAKDWALVLEQVKRLALRGERWAVEFYADRLMGKPVNTTQITGENGDLLKVIFEHSQDTTSDISQGSTGDR